MDRCILLAPAKINFYLEILGDRPDGFHELAMVMQTVDLCDRLVISRTGVDSITLRCNHPLVPADETNLAYRAAALMGQQFAEAFARYGGVHIEIDKQIPVGAGLAGGSGNAAAVLVGLNLLWKLGLTRAELEVLGAQLGSDIPFCIGGGTALATGRGEKIAPLSDIQGIHVVLAKYNSLSVSTPWAYQSYRQQFESSYVREPDDLSKRLSRVHSGAMVAAISQRDNAALGGLLYNDLEKVVLPAHPAVQALREALAGCPAARGVLMSGSGPTVFALADAEEDAQQIVAQVRRSIADEDLGLWIAPVIAKGIRLVAA
jgi:4-diphosphocytidyl-2-C-methyl-D-erythritol kinase